MISISSVSAQSRWGVPWYMCVARVSILSLAPYCCTLAGGRGGPWVQPMEKRQKHTFRKSALKKP